MEAYSSIQDSAFVTYIQRKRDAYDEGEDIEIEDLMRQAENKYFTLILEEKWNYKTKEQSQIISLQAKLNKLKGGKVKLGQRNRNARNSASQNNQSTQQKSNPHPSNKNSDQRFQETWA